MTDLTLKRETWPLRGTFRISRGARTEAEVVVVELTRGGARGRGECVPYKRYGESLDGVIAAIEALRGEIGNGLDREALQEAMPAGAARNALDCAFWDLEAKEAGQPVWTLAGLPEPGPVVTVYTLSLDSAGKMAEAAAAQAERPALKLKLAGPEDLDRVRAVREAAPKPKIVVDANEGWTLEQYQAYAPELKALGVAMIEQPLPAGEDAGLADIDRPVPLCADESCHDRATLPDLAGRYDLVNIKLDKTGGLTEALALKAEAEAAGFGIMVGCMIGTSLGMAPGVLVAQGAAVVDLDAPLLLDRDRPGGLAYNGSEIAPPEPDFWG